MPGQIRPNIIILFTDQQRYDTLGVNGSPICQTPNLDRLAKEGANFTRAYTVCALCTPARASFLTGKYPHNHGLLNNTHERDAVRLELPNNEVTFAQLLKEHGYRSGYVGKWHVGRRKTPVHWGFDTYSPGDRDYQRYLGQVGLSESVKNTVVEDPSRLVHPLTKQPYHAKRNIPIEATNAYFLAEMGIKRLRELVKETRSDGRPFLLRIDWQEPHWANIIPDPYASMYDPRSIPPWPNFGDTFEGKSRAHKRLQIEWGVDGATWDDWSALVARYWGTVTLIDTQIGRILAALEETGLADDTLVIFTSDHGDLTGSHGLFNKGPVPYEETYRIPLIMRWPNRLKPGRTIDAFAHLHDVMPTILEAAGVLTPKSLDARSLTPLLRGLTPNDWPESIFIDYHGDELGLYSQRILRTDRYKFVYNVPDIDELYDLESDPYEMRNLIDDPAYSDVRYEMARRLLNWMRRTDDMIARWAPAVLERY